MNEFVWTKSNVKKALGIKYDAHLAKLLNMTRGGVWAWAPEMELPESRRWQLRALRPDVFPLPVVIAPDEVA